MHRWRFVSKSEKANSLANEVLSRFHENAVFTHGQLENLSHHGDLRSVLECAGIADAITEYFDRKVARIARKRGTKRSLYEFWFDLAGTLESMKQVCIHYGHLWTLCGGSMYRWTLPSCLSLGPPVIHPGKWLPRSS